MPVEFKKKPGGAPLRERTAGGFEKPAQAERKGREPLVKTDIQQELTISDLHLNEELMGQPLLMRKYTKEFAKLKRQVKAIKNQLELKESSIRTLLWNDGKARKVAEVDAMVLSDVEVQKLRVELYDAEELQDEFEGIVKSIHQRHEMLKDLCANARKELT